MSLRVRLNLLITIMFVTILVLGALLVIHNARGAVAEETQSTARLALQLLEVAYASASPGGEDVLRARLREQMPEVEGARHLQVALIEGDRELPLAEVEPASRAGVPQWFARLVEPTATELRRSVAGPAGAHAEIVVRADPGDEIAESWDDTRPLLLLVLGVSIVANGLLYVVIGRWLRPVERIVAAMDGIEQGDYRARLPQFELPELANVASKFNHMAEVLERSREQNRHLAQQTLAIQEGERRALAHELHDELGQSISAINAVAVSIGQASRDGGGSGASTGAAAAGAATIAEISNHLYSVVRGMMRRLRPVLLDEFGLVRALEELADGWNERHADAFCKLGTRGRLDDLGDAVNISVYRIVQECLTNVSKHAHATAVAVDVERRRGEDSAADARVGDPAQSGGGERPDHYDHDSHDERARATDDGGEGVVRLTIADDGQGFEPDTASTGLGLLGMRERVEALHGKLDLVTRPGRGVRIMISIPIGGGRI
jgi:two-component system sensor histidine kinase UhpB